MRILDEQGQEITIEEVDLSLGYLVEEELLIEHIPYQSHYAVGHIYFDDGSVFTPASEDDPHIAVIDAARGIFRYIPQEGEESHPVKGMDIKLIVDHEEKDVYETIQRYKLFSEDEMVQKTLPGRMTAAEETLAETGLTIEDLILLMAEVLGGNEEKIPEEEEIPEEPVEEPVE